MTMVVYEIVIYEKKKRHAALGPPQPPSVEVSVERVVTWQGVYVIIYYRGVPLIFVMTYNQPPVLKENPALT